MVRRIEDVQTMLKEYDVRFIRVVFSDISGVQKNIAISSTAFDQALTSGVSFDGSAIESFAPAVSSDLILHPDLDTFTIVPWRSHDGGVARFYSSITYPDGRPFELDTRTLLLKAEKRALDMGFNILAGPECEFYLFREDNGEPLDRGGYFDLFPLDKGEDIRREIVTTLSEMGLSVERSHHEHGPGQNEIDFRYSSPLSAADKLLTFRTAVKTVAMQNALNASFLPKPIEGDSGNGLHINLSLFKDGKNLFSGFMSSRQNEASSFLAGIIERASDITAVACPISSSYMRLGEFEAPSRISWSSYDRTALVRIPFADESGSRMEYRASDSTANPYLLLALLIHAGLDGIEKKLPLEKEYEGHLPENRQKALRVFSESEFINKYLPRRVIDSYASVDEKAFLKYF